MTGRDPSINPGGIGQESLELCKLCGSQNLRNVKQHCDTPSETNRRARGDGSSGARYDVAAAEPLKVVSGVDVVQIQPEIEPAREWIRSHRVDGAIAIHEACIGIVAVAPANEPNTSPGFQLPPSICRPDI